MGDVNDLEFPWDEPVDRRALLGKAAAAGGALAAGGLLAGRATATPAKASVEDLLFYSSQFSLVAEQEAARRHLLSGFASDVELAVPGSGGDAAFHNRVLAEKQSGQGRGRIDLLGALHGAYAALQPENVLTDLSDVAKDFRTGKSAIPASFMTLGRLGTRQQLYLPWMQATYVIVANKSVLKYLPARVNPNKLTYGNFAQWAKNIAEKEGRPRLGFPASSNGLIHRFFQGYLVPSFTGRNLTKFKSNEAVAGWLYMRNLWRFVHPQSQAYSFMNDPLLSGEILLAWEHVARLKTALEGRPDDFAVFPAPRGPKGRAFMPVLAGLAIPRSSPHPGDAKLLIRHLLSLPVQARTLSALGFFPVIAGRLSKSISPGLRNEANAVKLMQTATDALPSLLPIGLGAEGGNFNNIYRDTFNAIVLKGEDPKKVVAEQGARIQEILTKTGAPCWAPDPRGSGPCRVG
jgi:multiple sugar transport system substrate-binding protein